MERADAWAFAQVRARPVRPSGGLQQTPPARSRLVLSPLADRPIRASTNLPVRSSTTMSHQLRHSTEPGSVRRRRGFLRRPVGTGRRNGQSIVEFALVVPLFVLLLVGIIEFAFALNSVLAVNFATREAALDRGGGRQRRWLRLRDPQAGRRLGRRCRPITAADHEVGSTSPTGTASRWQRTPTQRTSAPRHDCVVTGVDDDRPVHVDRQRGLHGHEALQRPRRLSRQTPRCRQRRRSTRSASRLRYSYSWRTPLAGLLGLSGTGYNIIQANTMRMEPIL